MKRWTIGGVAILLIGIAAFTLRMGCEVELKIEQPDVTPPAQRMGWNEEAARSEATRQLVAQMQQFEITGVVRDNRKANVRLWEYAKQIGVKIPYYRQEIGDCVSFGAKHAVDYLQCVQIALGQRAEFQSAYPPYIYGTSRVQIGGGRLSGDGSVGAWAAKAVQQYGVLSIEADGVPSYSGQIAKQWGRRGPPEQFINVAQETLVKTASPVRSADDVRDAIVNGYPCTIASNAGFGSISERDGRQVGRWTTSWAHQMCIIGYDGSTNEGPWFYVLNSWGPNAHPKPLQNEPPGGFWISYKDCDRIVKQGDSYAFSAFDGFPSQELDFHIFDRAEVAWLHIGKDLVMVGMFALACGVLLFFVCRCRNRSVFSALILGMVASAAQAQEMRFDVLPTPAAESDPLNFDVFEPMDTAGLDFAVLDPCVECNCEETGVCLCDDCKCKNCPKKDKRPVITVRTMPGCLPCQKAKAASEGQSLQRFRFEFIEQESVEGGAPRYEWQGADCKWAVNGYHNAEFINRVYDESQKSQKSKTARKEKRRSDSMQCSGGVCFPIQSRSPVTYFSSQCVGGSCRSCR